MQEQSEERQLPASWQKLREARRKGQVPQSRDLVAGATLCATLAYLLLAWPTIWSRVVALIQAVAPPPAGPFSAVAAEAVHHALLVLLLVTAPPAAIAVVAAVAAGLLATRGGVFSVEPIKPKFQHLNPAHGLKRIASLRNLVEFAKGLAKLVALAAVFAVVLHGWLQPLFETPACGESCLGPMVLAVLKPFALTAALAFLLVGLLDLPVQRSLFLRDMRMTRSEYKRERKSYEGDPLLRGELKRQRRELVTRPIKVGLRNALVAVVDGDRIVGLRYQRGETRVPVVVARAGGPAGERMIAEARRLGIPLFDEPELVAALYRRGIGESAPPESFPQIARLLGRAGLV